MKKINMEINVKTKTGADKMHPKSTAEIVEYNNFVTGINANNVQQAIDGIIPRTKSYVVVNATTSTGIPVTGASVSIVNNALPEDIQTHLFQAGESSCKFTVASGNTYTVSITEIIGYATPSDVIFKAVGDDTKTINFYYSLYTQTLVTTVNTNDGTSVNGSVITIANITTPSKTQTYTFVSGQTQRSFEIISGNNYTVSVSDKSGYQTPSPISFVADISGTKNISFQYILFTETVIVNVSTTSGESVAGSLITITDNTDTSKTQSYTLTSGQSSHTFAMLSGHSCTASVSAKNLYTTPPSVTFVTTQFGSRTIGMKYSRIDYGYRITKAEADPYARVTYLNDCAGFTPGKMNWETSTWQWGSWQPFVEQFFRPCIIYMTGQLVSYLDRNNQTLNADGVTPSYISSLDSDVNAMVEVKTLYTWEYEDATYSYHMISDYQLNPNYVGFPFVNSNGVVQDKIYFPMFEGSLDKYSRLRSIAGQLGIGIEGRTAQQLIDSAIGNGSGYFIDYWSAWNFMAILHTLVGRSTDTKNVFGYGGRDQEHTPTGALKSVGAFSGSNLIPYSPVKTFYMENSFGGSPKWCSGIVTARQGMLKIKPTPPYNLTGEGYGIFGEVPSRGYIKNVITSSIGYIVSDTTGNSANYFCDYFTGGENGYCVLMCDGCYGISLFYASSGNSSARLFRIPL